MPISPRSPSCLTIAYGNDLVRSSSSATGATSPSAKSRTVRRISSWSSGRSKSIRPFCRSTSDRLVRGDTQGMRPPLSLPRTIRVKLALAFAGVLGVMLASLGLVRVETDRAEHAHSSALAWHTAIAGASEQAAGTRQQQAAQALYVATFNPRFKREWEAGVTVADAGGKQVQALHDPVIGKIAAGATAADHRHDDAVHNQLF